jgi:hypothetical protein
MKLDWLGNEQWPTINVHAYAIASPSLSFEPRSKPDGCGDGNMGALKNPSRSSSLQIRFPQVSSVPGRPSEGDHAPVPVRSARLRFRRRQRLLEAGQERHCRAKGRRCRRRVRRKWDRWSDLVR